jgi:DNA-binding NarL/FixJ family response regulator
MQVDKERAVIRIVMVDGHDLYRTGLASYLEREPDMHVIAQAPTGSAGLRLIRQLQPHVVMLGDDLPDIRLADVVTDVVRGRGAARVVVLSTSMTAAGMIAGLTAGARSYLGKDSSVDEVAGAVRAAATGNSWLSAAAADVVFGQLRQAPPHDQSRHAADRLSARELEVLKLLARGMDNSEIASALTITQSTAKNHVSNILTKLEVPSRLLAAIYAIRHELA